MLQLLYKTRAPINIAQFHNTPTPTFYNHKKINIARQNYTHPLADKFYVCHTLHIKKKLSSFITLPNFANYPQRSAFSITQP